MMIPGSQGKQKFTVREFPDARVILQLTVLRLGGLAAVWLFRVGSAVEDDAVELRGVGFERGIGPYHEIGTRHLLFYRPLGAEAALDLVLAPSAPRKTLALGGIGARDANDGVKEWRRFGFKEQRNEHGAVGASGSAPNGNFRLPDGTDAGMENGFKIAASGGVGEYQAGQFTTVQPAIARQDGRTESSGYFRQGGLSRLNQLPGDEVSVGHAATPVAKELAGGGFAHADSAGDAEELHCRRGGRYWDTRTAR
ncbi:MAG: hypothetical protein ABSG59_24270 [Verrucomicrobiota bacterium]|jgi:hypothetical protein